MFIHPTKFLQIASQHIILFQEDYDVICKAIEDGVLGDIEKAKSSTGKLIPVKTLVSRNGKVFTETVYINPDKRKPEDLKQKYRKGSTSEIKHTKKETDRITLDTNVLKKGDLVKIKLQDGSETVGQFRNFAVSTTTGKDLVVIRATIKTREGKDLVKTITRNASDVIKMNDIKQEVKKVERKFDPNSFKVGDSVSLTLRKKTDKGTDLVETEGVLVRKTGYGFIILMKDGEYVERPITTLTKSDESKIKLTEEQEVILNKAIKSIKRAIQDKNNLISIFEKRNKPKEVEKLKEAIEEDKITQQNYFEVFRGNLKFEDISSELIKPKKLDYEE